MGSGGPKEETAAEKVGGPFPQCDEAGPGGRIEKGPWLRALALFYVGYHRGKWMALATDRGEPSQICRSYEKIYIKLYLKVRLRAPAELQDELRQDAPIRGHKAVGTSVPTRG